MNLRVRVRRLEGPGGICRVCAGRTLALRYDPPPPAGTPALFAGLPLPPETCPACGRPPRLVLTVPPPTESADAARGDAPR